MKKSVIIGIFTSLIIITCLVLFIIGLRLYIINKDKDKNLNTPILLMTPIVVVSIVIILLYIDYKFGNEALKGLQGLKF
jgi:hypothetical protein